MKKLMIAFSIIGAGALIASAATEKLSTNAWFSITTASKVGGTIAATGDATLEEKDGKFEIDSDIDNPVTFEATAAATELRSKVTFTLDPAPVPPAVLPTKAKLLESGAKVAFAIVKGDSANAFQAWVGGNAWVALSGTPGDTEYTLVMDFDNRDDNKVRFTVGETVLTGTGATDGWFDYGSTAIAKNIDFVGSATFSLLVGNQIALVSEVVPVGDGTIEIRKADLDKFNVPEGGTLDAYIASDVKTAFSGTWIGPTGITVGEAYALGLVAEDSTTHKMAPVNGGNLVAKAIAGANVSGGIKIGLNVTPPEGTGATIEYSILNGAEKVNVGNNLVIPTSEIGTGSIKTFKVQAKVIPAGAK